MSSIYSHHISPLRYIMFLYFIKILVPHCCSSLTILYPHSINLSINRFIYLPIYQLYSTYSTLPCPIPSLPFLNSIISPSHLSPSDTCLQRKVVLAPPRLCTAELHSWSSLSSVAMSCEGVRPGQELPCVNHGPVGTPWVFHIYNYSKSL